MPQEISGGLDGTGLRVAVVAARFNNVITKNLMEGALGTLSEYGVRDGDISTAWVPGSFELPLAAKTFAESGRYDAVICLGAVIRGETSHYDMVCNQAASGIAAVGRETGIPTMFGVLTTGQRQSLSTVASVRSKTPWPLLTPSARRTPLRHLPT